MKKEMRDPTLGKQGHGYLHGCDTNVNKESGSHLRRVKVSSAKQGSSGPASFFTEFRKMLFHLPDLLEVNRQQKNYQNHIKTVQILDRVGSLFESLNHKILNLGYEVFEVFLKKKEIYHIANLMNEHDTEIRQIAFKTLVLILKRHPAAIEWVEEVVLNQCVEFVRYERRKDSIGHFVMVSVVFLDAFDNDKLELCFDLYLLPVIMKLLDDENIFFDLVITEYCGTSKKCRDLAMNKFCREFDKHASMGQDKIFRYVWAILERCIYLGSIDNDEEFVVYLCELLKKGFSTQVYFIINSLDALFMNELARDYFKTRMTRMLPEFFDSLYRSSKCFWRQEQRCRLLNIIEYLITDHSHIFEECLIKYNKNKSRSGTEENDGH